MGWTPWRARSGPCAGARGTRRDRRDGGPSGPNAAGPSFRIYQTRLTSICILTRAHESRTSGAKRHENHRPPWEGPPRGPWSAAAGTQLARVGPGAGTPDGRQKLARVWQAARRWRARVHTATRGPGTRVCRRDGPRPRGPGAPQRTRWEPGAVLPSSRDPVTRAGGTALPALLTCQAGPRWAPPAGQGATRPCWNLVHRSQA